MLKLMGKKYLHFYAQKLYLCKRMVVDVNGQVKRKAEDDDSDEEEESSSKKQKTEDDDDEEEEEDKPGV